MKIEDIERLLAGDRIFEPIRLPSSMEAAFREQDHERLRRQTVLGLALGTFFYVMLSTFDWLIVPDVYWLGLYVRIGIGLPISLAMLWIVMDQRRSGSVCQWAVGLVGLSDSLTISAVTALSHAPAAIVYLSANLIILGFTINLVGLTTRAAAVVCGMIQSVTMVAVTLSPASSLGAVVSYFFVGTMISAACVLANWCLQNERRRIFLTMHRDHIRLRTISQQRDLLERLAAIDPLTGIANRRGFDAMLAGDCAQAGADARLTVAMIDIDCFKLFNDTYGHAKGDAVLKAVATALAQACEAGTRLGRMGGEEFAVAVVGEDAGSFRVAERLCHAVEALAIAHPGSAGKPVVTISVGVAHGRATDWDSGRARLFSRADEALYEAKRSGRSRVVVMEDDARGKDPASEMAA